MSEIPRRIRLDRNTDAELAIRNVIHRIEAVGADVRLTNAVVLLGRALHHVSDFVDDVTTPDPGDPLPAALTAAAERELAKDKEIERLSAIIEAIDLAGSGAQVSEFWESFPSVRRVVDLRAEYEMASHETTRLLAVNGESNAVCSCGCELTDHEERGEEGWSCDNEAHECVPTSQAVRQILTALRDENVRLAERVKWFEAAGGITMSTRIHQLMADVARLTSEVESYQRALQAEYDKREALDAEVSRLTAERGRIDHAPGPTADQQFTPKTGEPA